MKEPELVIKCINSMKKSIDNKIPVHIKTRIGIDDNDSYEFFKDFVSQISEQAGVNEWIIHSRKAFLKGLSPKENRNIPPLLYDRCIRLKKDLPHLTLQINGGFKTFQDIEDILIEDNNLQGVMLGRLAQDNPWILSDIDRTFYGVDNPGLNRKEILEIYAEYGDHVISEKKKINWSINWSTLNKPIITLFTGETSSNVYRRFLSDSKLRQGYDKYSDFINAAIAEFEIMNKEALYSRPPKLFKDSDHS